MGDKLAALAVYVFVRFGVARRHKFKPTVDALGIFYWAFLELKNSHADSAALPIGSMVYGNTYHQYTPNVSIYTMAIHGSYALLVGPSVADSAMHLDRCGFLQADHSSCDSALGMFHQDRSPSCWGWNSGARGSH